MNIVSTNHNLTEAPPPPAPVLPAVQGPAPFFADLDRKLEAANMLARAKLVPEAFRNSPGDILLALEMASDLAISPMAALNGIHVIKGRAGVSSELMRSLVLKAGHRFRVLDSTAQECTVEITRADDRDRPQSFTFRIEDAERAGLTTNPSYARWPAQMLLARASAIAVRAVAPDVLLGFSTTEELGEWEPPEATVEAVSEAPVPLYGHAEAESAQSEASGPDAADQVTDAAATPEGVEDPETGAAFHAITEAEIVAEEPAAKPTARKPATTKKLAEAAAKRAEVKASGKDFLTAGTRMAVEKLKATDHWPALVNRMADEGIPAAVPRMTETQAQQVLNWHTEMINNPPVEGAT